MVVPFREYFMTLWDPKDKLQKRTTMEPMGRFRVQRAGFGIESPRVLAPRSSGSSVLPGP